MRIRKGKKLNINTQFFLTYLCVALIIAFSISLFFYKYTSNILIERETSSFHEMADNFMTQTDNEIRTMDDVSINIGYSNLVQDRLKQYFDLESADTNAFSALVELFVIVNGVEYKVPQMKIYDNSGKVLAIGTNTVKYEVELEELSWTAIAKEKKGLKTISMPYQGYDMVNNTRVVPYYMSLYRTFYNKYRAQVGYIETMQACKTIFKSITSYTSKNPDGMQIYVFDEAGELIYPYEKDAVLEDYIYKHYYELSLNGEEDTETDNPATKDRELATFVTSGYTKWTYVCVQSKAEIIEPVRNFRMILFLFAGVILLLTIMISYFMAKRLTRPIHQLLSTIGQTRLDTLGSLKKDKMNTSFNEFDELNDAFHNMSSELKESMDELIETRQQELKSRSLALQSQMNPHFYNNSLYSIMILSENGQSEDVITLCRNLSGIMRYVTKTTDQRVSVAEEINYVSKYLYCMKIRYQSSLNYVIEIPKELETIMIPKLIIQPLVENALKYGTDCTPPWEITIRGVVTEEYWKIEVTDNGIGFTKDALKTMEERIRTAQVTIGMPELEIDGMGLLNVYLRWKLFCDKRVIFEYGNRPEGGSIVTIGMMKSDPVK